MQCGVFGFPKRARTSPGKQLQAALEATGVLIQERRRPAVARTACRGPESDSALWLGAVCSSKLWALGLELLLHHGSKHWGAKSWSLGHPDCGQRSRSDR